YDSCLYERARSKPGCCCDSSTGGHTAVRKLYQIFFPVLALSLAPAIATAQSFRVQCPSSTITHPDPTNAGVNNSEPAYNGPTQFTTNKDGYVSPTSGTVNGAIKCQQISGGDGYMTEADGTQTFMFSFGPLSGDGAVGLAPDIPNIVSGTDISAGSLTAPLAAPHCAPGANTVTVFTDSPLGVSVGSQVVIANDAHSTGIGGTPTPAGLLGTY